MAEDQGTILLAIGRLEGKLDGYQTKQSEHSDRLNNHGERLADLEKLVSNWKGRLAIITVIAGGIWALVLKYGTMFAL